MKKPYQYNDMIRVWNGYRLITNGTKLKLTEKMVPVIKLPKMSDAEKTKMINNVGRMTNNVPRSLMWLFCFANSISTHSGLPYIHTSDITDSIIGSYMNNFQIYVTSDHQRQYDEFVKRYNNPIALLSGQDQYGCSQIVRRLKEGDISFITLMKYHSDVAKVDTSSIRENSLLTSRLKTVIDACLHLEDNFQFSEKVIKTQQNYVKKLNKV